MNSMATGQVPIALVVFFVFWYLNEQSRHGYFRAWQLAWAAYTLHCALEVWNRSRALRRSFLC